MGLAPFALDGDLTSGERAVREQAYVAVLLLRVCTDPEATLSLGLLDLL